MKILLAADGSPHTKKALAFLIANENLCRPEDELIVLHVQTPVPPEVKRMLGSAAVNEYHADEARKVLEPIEHVLASQTFQHSTSWVVGSPTAELLAAAKKQKAQMIVMGTHGHGLLGRALLGSVAQRVVADCEVPVLLVK